MTVLFPTKVSSFDFQVECTDRTVQYKLNAQSLRLFGLHSDVNDAHRAGASRLQNKQNIAETNRCKSKRTGSYVNESKRVKSHKALSYANAGEQEDPSKDKEKVTLFSSLILKWREQEATLNVCTRQVVLDFTNLAETGLGVESLHFAAISMRANVLTSARMVPHFWIERQSSMKRWSGFEYVYNVKCVDQEEVHNL